LTSLNTFPDRRFGRRWSFGWAIAGLALLCFAVPASALDPKRMVSQYMRDSWGPERAFPGGSISAIAQTTDGYLWIGTDRGLIRFDGLTFRQFEHGDHGRFTIGPVRTLLTDAQGDLWILLQNTKVFRNHEETFELARGEAENGITAIGREAKGGVLLSSIAMGTLTYNGNRFLTVPSAALSGGSANSEGLDDRSSRFSLTPGIMPDRLPAPTSAVISIAGTNDGKIWLGTRDRGLFYLQGGHVSAAAKVSPEMKVNCLLPLGNSDLWIGTGKGVLRWNGTGLSRVGVPPSLQHADVLSMIRDRDTNIWVGTTRGLLRFNADGISSFTGNTASAGGAVTALFEDREGNIWIGGAQGLEQLRDSAFATYSVPGLKSQSMGPVYVDHDDRIWFAPSEGGLRWLREGYAEPFKASASGGDIVYSITGRGSDLWIGRQRGGLTHLRYVNNAFTTETYTRADGLAQNSVYAVYQDRSGAVWSGTLSGGVSELRNGHFTNYTTATGLASNTVSSIAEGADGTMWFGTPNGLNAMSANGWRTYTVRDGLPSRDVNCLLRDSTGVLWTGTAEGLAFLASGHVHAARGVPDSLREPIFGLAEDRNGWLWIATANHVLQVKRSSLMSGTLNEADLREFGLADGLRGNEGVKRYQSVVSDSQGHIWFSTNRGLSVVNPAREPVNPVPALVHIEAVLVDGSPFDLRGAIRVPAAKQRTTFRYLGLSLGNSDRVRYRHRLDDFDQEWSEPVTSREATYANLGAGTYRFRVMACNSDGLWNGSETAVRIEVDPALWQTWWFRLSCVLCAGLAALVAYRVRMHQLTRLLNVRFEERLAERTRIARDFHDTLLQSFHGLLLRFQAAHNLLPGRAVDAKEVLEAAIDNAAQAITEARDAVQDLRSSTIVTNDLAKAIEVLGGELRAHQRAADGDSADSSVQVEGTPLDLNPILRDEIYRIAGEALRNSFRHARARRIEVEIRYAERHFSVRVRDDGIGIDASVLSQEGRPGHFGLRGMRERSKSIGGQLEVWSEHGAGTEVELTIPASVAYGRHARRRFRLFRSKMGTIS
jgi:signal transduction histidine kinase/ligand-binding sensor domain-containing protein